MRCDADADVALLRQQDALPASLPPRFFSGPIAGTAATCSWGTLDVGGGTQNLVSVANSAGGSRDFFLVLPERYSEEGPRTLLIAVHGGLVVGDRYMRGACERACTAARGGIRMR
jgi:hypothetical protein